MQLSCWPVAFLLTSFVEHYESGTRVEASLLLNLSYSQATEHNGNHKLQLDSSMARVIQTQMTEIQWTDQPGPFYVGIVSAIDDEGVIELRADSGHPPDLLRLKLWRTEVDPQILRFLLLQRRILCQQVSGSAVDSLDDYRTVTCTLVLDDQHKTILGIERFIAEFIHQ